MSRIYLVSVKDTTRPVRYVRANTLSGAIRAFANEIYEARPATSEDMWQASKGGDLAVLDALEEQA